MQDLFDEFDIDQSILKEVKAAVGRLVKYINVLVGNNFIPYKLAMELRGYVILVSLCHIELQGLKMVILLYLMMKVPFPPPKMVRF